MGQESKKDTNMYNQLMERLSSKLCLECQSCVVSCPYDSLEMGKKSPVLKDECKNCGLCITRCPQFSRKGKESERIFKKEEDLGTLGSYKNAFSARSKVQKISKRAQDGGTITTILYNLLDDGFIDGAIVTGEGNEPWKPKGRLVTEKEDLLNYEGTIYSLSPIIQTLKEASEKRKKRKLAIVGTPCQVQALRRMEVGKESSKKLVSNIKLIIGLFCMESYPYENVVETVEKKLNLKIEDITKFDIKKGKLIAETEQKKEKIPVKEMKPLMYSFCETCLDFSSELADLSIGNVGAPKSHNVLLPRTEIGEDALQIADRQNLEIEKLEDIKPGLSLTRKLSEKKKQNRLEEIKKRWKEDKPIPPKILNCPNCGEKLSESYSKTYFCDFCGKYYTINQLLPEK